MSIVSVSFPLHTKSHNAYARRLVQILGMHTKYLLNPCPPLIANPKVCAQLSVAALQRNLAAHAQANPAIMASGSKEEMIARLEVLLEMRKMDMLVRDMILGPDGDGDV